MARRFPFFLVFTVACGSSGVVTDAGSNDASSDACGSGKKCITFEAGPFDGSFADVSDDVPSSNQCPATAPIPPAVQFCFSSPKECDYTLQTDAGSIAVTCACVPSGEDAFVYQCAEPSSLCMSSGGVIDTSLKACAQDTDCMMQPQQTDCCGSQLWVGVNQSSYAQLEMCEVSWAKQFPACSCPSTMKTEDGLTTTTTSGKSVHCVSNQCMTTTP